RLSVFLTSYQNAVFLETFFTKNCIGLCIRTIFIGDMRMSSIPTKIRSTLTGMACMSLRDFDRRKRAELWCAEH
ncbi:hypothetical protein PMAYCL1PPCAC_15941, partial [Pristionchus mayeri]